MQEEDKQRWLDVLREFQSCDKTEQLLRFIVRSSTREHLFVEKAFWLKYDPVANPERVAALDWRGTLTTDVSVRTPIWTADGVWFVTGIVREPNLTAVFRQKSNKYDHGSYYDEAGDPFDPDNVANWDGDQQVGFRA